MRLGAQSSEVIGLRQRLPKHSMSIFNAAHNVRRFLYFFVLRSFVWHCISMYLQLDGALPACVQGITLYTSTDGGNTFVQACLPIALKVCVRVHLTRF